MTSTVLHAGSVQNSNPASVAGGALGVHAEVERRLAGDHRSATPSTSSGAVAFDLKDRSEGVYPILRVKVLDRTQRKPCCASWASSRFEVRNEELRYPGG